MIKDCKHCGIKFKPSKWKIKYYNWCCNDCLNKKRKDYRLKRKKEGNPVISTKMNSEYWREYEKTPDRMTKKKVRSKLRSAVKSGKIKKLKCNVCGDKNSEAHHPDYKKPLSVIWLCRQHHNELHNKNK